MPSRYTFTDPRLVKLDGFQVQLDESHERGDIILNRPRLRFSYGEGLAPDRTVGSHPLPNAPEWVVAL